jgi:tRNA nucleotidyltransferase/poly(A) polymerase
MRYVEDKEEAAPVRMKSPMEVPEAIRRIHKAFRDANKHLFVVGGAVRDHLLGKAPKDFDLATDAPPDQVMQVLTAHGIKHTESIGNQFGVVVAKVDNEPYEIATFRKDLEAKRQTKVKFSSIQDDAVRRDLTINALYYDMDSQEVVDYVGGIEDLQAGRVRTVGDPDKRFREDALRVLRYLRFLARVQAGGMEHIDEETQAAIRKRVESGLRSDNGEPVAPERIRDEFIKGFKTAVSPSSYLKLYDDLGLLTRYVFPGLNVSEERPDSRNYILVIGHLLKNNDPEKIKRRLIELKYTNDEVNKIVYLVHLTNLRAGHLETQLKDRPQYLYALKRAEQGLSDEELAAWARMHQLDPEVLKKFRAYQLKNRQDVPGASELEGPEIGKLITRHNTEEMMRQMGFKEWLLHELG